MNFIEKYSFIFTAFLFLVPISILAQSPFESTSINAFSLSDQFDCDPKKDAETLEQVKHYQPYFHEKTIGFSKYLSSNSNYKNITYKLTCPQQSKTIFH